MDPSSARDAIVALASDEERWLDFLNRPLVVIAMGLLSAGLLVYLVRRFYFPKKADTVSPDRTVTRRSRGSRPDTS